MRPPITGLRASPPGSYGPRPALMLRYTSNDGWHSRALLGCGCPAWDALPTSPRPSGAGPCHPEPIDPGTTEHGDSVAIRAPPIDPNRPLPTRTQQGNRDPAGFSLPGTNPQAMTPKTGFPGDSLPRASLRKRALPGSRWLGSTPSRPGFFPSRGYTHAETEREGFEPSVQFPAHRISSAVP